jgi:SAM-dependent methyltransferase
MAKSSDYRNYEVTPVKVNLYDNAYGNYALGLYREVRIETYGEDLGQTSWVTAEESSQIPLLLQLTAESAGLEVGCGSGRYALRLAEKVGCQVVGLDNNAHGVETAADLARKSSLGSRVRFEQCDASQELGFDDGCFDAAFANDVMCHVPGRAQVLGELFRVLKPGGRLLFSDALVIGGIVSQEEIATRSSIGYYLFSPPGENERLIGAAGFRLIAVNDTAANVAAIAERWYHARQKREHDLIAAEGESTFQGLQRFLDCVHRLTSERRLLRYVYVAAKDTR